MIREHQQMLMNEGSRKVRPMSVHDTAMLLTFIQFCLARKKG